MAEQGEVRYVKNEKGWLIPEAQIKPLDLMRHNLVEEIAETAKRQREELRKVKARFFDDIAAFAAISDEQYKVRIGGEKGNITLHSFDAQYRIQVDISMRMAFDERLHAAKALLNECIQRWGEGARPELMTLIQDAFQVDKQGSVEVWRILALKRLNFEDEQWKKAMEAINDSMIVIGSKQYIRVYERRPDGKYEAISLDFASI